MASSITPTSSSSIPVLMKMGCTNDVITYRAVGNEIVCLQSPVHGEQQLANFNPTIGDVIGIDDILEQTQAQDNLSDVANYITSAITSGGTTLYFDAAGTGVQGTPIAFLRGVDTNVAQLVSDGGMQYVPDAITLNVTFGETFTFRTAGLETAKLNIAAPGVAPQQFANFNPTGADVLDLSKVLNNTPANPNLSNLASYVTATVVDGNTILSVLPSDTGPNTVATPFAEILGQSVTVAQLVADNAISFTPTLATVQAFAGMTFLFRPEGNELAAVGTSAKLGPAQIHGFSLTDGDDLNVKSAFVMDNVQADMSQINSYLSTTENNGNTTIWFDKTGSGHGGGLAIAVLDNSNVTIGELVTNHAISF